MNFRNYLENAGTIDQLWAAAEQDLPQTTSLLVLADAIEESGDIKLSGAIRWAVKNQRLPQKLRHYQREVWGWRPSESHPRDPAALPSEGDDSLYSRLHRLSDASASSYEGAYFWNFRRAVSALGRSIKRS